MRIRIYPVTYPTQEPFLFEAETCYTRGGFFTIVKPKAIPLPEEYVEGVSKLPDFAVYPSESIGMIEIYNDVKETQ